MSDPSEVRITLYGKTGVGKSAVGNTILGMDRFSSRSGFSSVTRRCQKESAVVAHRTVTVVDTPDFFHSTREEDLVSEIDRSVILSSPGVHAFLYVLEPSTFTIQEEEIVSEFKQTYGEEVFRHTIVLFTHGDQLQLEDVDTLISQNETLRSLVSLCGGRFTVLNNEAPADREQVYYLLDIIDRMVPDQNSFYTLEMLQEAQRRAEEQRERSLAQQYRKEERARMKHQMDIERAIRGTEIRVWKEMEEELEKTRAAIAESDKYSTEGEKNMDDEKQENILKRWFVHRQKYFHVIAVFSLSLGCMFSTVSADRWRFVRGCGLGGSAAALGVMTGKLWLLIWRSQFRIFCSSSQQRPNVVYQYLNKALGVLCGGVLGTGVGFTGSDHTPVILLAALAGAAGACSAMHRLW